MIHYCEQCGTTDFQNLLILLNWNFMFIVSNFPFPPSPLLAMTIPIFDSMNVTISDAQISGIMQHLSS